MRLRAIFAVVVLGMFGSAAVAEPRPVAPGDAITVDGGAGCTAGFLFLGSDGARYLSTAGHCVLGEAQGSRAWKPGLGPVVKAAGQAIGRAAFAENVPTQDGDDFYDFALVLLDKATVATAAVRSYGVPTGMNTAKSQDPARLRVYGQGTGVSEVTPGRELLAPNLNRPDHVYAHGALLFGDSGAPVLDETGRAVGLVLGAGGIPVSIGIGIPKVGHDGALNRIGRLLAVLRHATKATGVRFRLAT